MNTKNEFWFILILYVICSLFFSYRLIFQHGVIGYQHDWPFPESVEGLQLFARESFMSYSDRGLGTSPSYTTNYIFTIVVSIIGWLGLSGGALSKFILLFLLSSSGTSFYYLMREFRSFKPPVLFFSGLIYILTPFFFYRIIAGHIYFAIAYALFPLYTLLIYRTFLCDNDKQLIRLSLVSVLVLLVLTWQIQFYIFALFVFTLLSLSIKGRWKQKLYSGCIQATLIIAYAVPWILPLMLKRRPSQVFQGALSLASIDRQSNFTELYNLYTGRGSAIPYLENAWEYISPEYGVVSSIALLIITIIVLYGMYCASKLKNNQTINHSLFTLSSAVVMILVLFFAKGTNEPLGEINIFLYRSFPVFGLFREIYHIAFPLIFLYGVFITHTLNTLFNKSKTMFALCCIIVTFGTLPVYLTGNFAGSLKVHTREKQIQTLDPWISEERAFFVPSLQPYTPDVKSAYGGADLFQVYNNVSSLPQGSAQNISQRNYMNFLNRCLIFDTFCRKHDFVSHLQNIGITRLVVLKDLFSLNHRVSGMGVDGNFAELFQNFKYQEVIKELDLKILYEDVNSTVLEIPNSKSLFTFYSSSAYLAGGINPVKSSFLEKLNFFTIHNQSDVLKSQEPEITKAIVVENKLELLNIESNPDTITIQPGFFVDQPSWLSYFQRWWREGYSQSGYNGVHSSTTGNDLVIPIPLTDSTTYTMWFNLNSIAEKSTSTLQVSIPEASFQEQITFNEDSYLSGVVSLEIPITASSSNTLQLKLLSGSITLDSLHFVPYNNSNHNTPIQEYILNNTSATIASSDTQTYSFTSDIHSYQTSIFDPSTRETKFKSYEMDSRRKIVINFDTSSTNEVEYVSLTNSLGNIPISLFNYIGTFYIPYATPVPEDIVIDTQIIVRNKGERQSIFLQRYKPTSQNGIAKVNTIDLNNKIQSVIPDADFDEIRIESISILLNKRTGSELQETQHEITLSNPYFATGLDQFLSSETYIDLLSYLSPAEYFQQQINSTSKEVLSPIKLDLERNNIVRPYNDSTRQTSLSIVNKNTFNLISNQQNNLNNEFATTSFMFKDYPEINDIRKFSSLVIPVELEFENSYVDLVMVYGEEDTTRLIVSRQIEINDQQYLLANLNQIPEVYEGKKIIGFEVVANKRPNNISTTSQYTIKDPQFLILKDGSSLYDLPDKKITVAVYSAVDSNYSLHTQLESESLLQEVFLTKGMNKIEIPYRQRTEKFLHLILVSESWRETPIDPVSLSFEKQSSARYTFQVPEELGSGYIVQATSFDPDWKINFTSNMVDAVPTSNIYNGYKWDKQNSAMSVTAYYRLQIYRQISLISCIILLAINIIMVCTPKLYDSRKIQH